MKRALTLLCALVLLAGCRTGGIHRKGDRQIAIDASYGDPISGSSLGFDGKGSAPNAGVGVSYQHFVSDRFAVWGRVGYRWFDQSDGSVHAGEFEAGTRWLLFEIGRAAFSIDGGGGGMVGDVSVPEAGTHLNWVFGFGPTVEIRMDENTTIFFGYQWRHLSNGRGGNAPGNPTQNDHRFSAGIAFGW